MKKFALLTIALTILVFNCQSQSELPIDSIENIVKFQEVVEIEGQDKNALYARGYEWIAKTFNSANDVIQLKDKEEGVIVL
jgi:hypothetical protein